MAFQSEAEAAGFMEAIDVDDGEYDAAYLVDGTVLLIRILQGRDGPVALERTDQQHREVLLERIRSFQEANGLPVDVSDLTGFADRLRRQAWARRWPRRPHWLAHRLHGSGPKAIDPS
jgi:hypothetical protein